MARQIAPALEALVWIDGNPIPDHRPTVSTAGTVGFFIPSSKKEDGIAAGGKIKLLRMKLQADRLGLILAKYL
ncbi:MAG TPA: hypothetical protein VF800_31810 [Telluria sp.]|jgi:hypothetical protein